MLASSRTGLALYFTPSSSARQRAHTVRPYGWDACFMSVTHYKPTCREWSRPFRDFVLAEAEPAGTISDSNSVESILNRIWKGIQHPRLEFTKESLHLRPKFFTRSFALNPDIRPFQSFLFCATSRTLLFTGMKRLFLPAVSCFLKKTPDSINTDRQIQRFYDFQTPPS